MSILMNDSSAWYLWLRTVARTEASPVPPPTPSRMSRATSFGRGEVLEAAYFLPPGWPVHALVPNDRTRNRVGTRCRVWSGELPPGSVARLSENVLVSTPEFLFLQAAARMTFVQLVLFGYELCALYTLRLPGGNYVELGRPITSREKIATFLEGCDGAYGVNRARAAIPWVLGRSRSPRESRLAASLVLPRKRGGQGLHGIELNKVVPLTPTEQRIAGKGHYEVDVAIDGTDCVLEYYGKESHAGEVRNVKDIRRESILASKGIIVHGVTKEQAENVQELERLAKMLVLAQGKRWRQPTPAQRRAMRSLMRELYLR